MDRNGVKWNREETILAYDLYCRTQFGKITSSNPEIIELANMLGRTPASVAMKMSNLAHFDPELRKRKIAGMSHGSKLDEEIFREFENDWLELSYQASQIRSKYTGKTVNELLELDTLPEGHSREEEVKVRVGQYFFRMSVLSSYKNRCCVTGLAIPSLLVASHIKPWKDSDDKKEKTNPSNGLCLNALHDRAFDKGFITIDQNYRLIISTQLKNVKMDLQTREWFMSYENKAIDLPDKFRPGKDFIEYHNDVIFQH